MARTSRHGPALRSLGRDRPGGALLEVMLALAILAGAVTALAGLIVLASNANADSRAGSRALVLASQKMEQLMGLAWGYGPSGEDRVDLTTNIAVWPEADGGSGLRESPEGSLSSNTPGFVDYVDGDGRWVGSGASAPAGALFLRRWSIRPLPDRPLDTLVLRVVVMRVGSEASGTISGATSPGAAQLSCIRTRRGT